MSKISSKQNLLPAGFSDVLFPKSENQNHIVEKILNFFADFNYLRVNPPLIEFEETLFAKGPGSVLKENSFRIMDPISQKMMALRSDMTTQISRIASSRMSHYPRPLRISYSGDVLRVKSSNLNMDRQITQVGAEIIGDFNSDSETEIILIGLKTLKSLNIKNLSIDLNFPMLTEKLLSKCSQELVPKILLGIEKKDYKLIQSFNFPNKKEILNLMKSSGIFTSSSKYLSSLIDTNKNNKSIKHLVNIAQKIKENFSSVNIILDPLEMNSFNYHDGITFTIFSKGIRTGIAKGGNYKTISQENATGISIYTERLNYVLDLTIKRKIVLLKSLDFKNAEKLIKDGFTINFTNKKTKRKFLEIAKQMKCNYVFYKNKLEKVI